MDKDQECEVLKNRDLVKKYHHRTGLWEGCGRRTTWVWRKRNIISMKNICGIICYVARGKCVLAPPTPSPGTKVEINTKEHFNVLGLIKHEFSVNSQWFSGNCQTTTYHLEELLGTKMRALYQRRKGRDLFDLWKALTTQDVDNDKIIRCYRKYIGFVVDSPPTKKEYLLNMEQKVQDIEFLGDIEMLLRPNENYNPQKAWELVRKELIEKL